MGLFDSLTGGGASPAPQAAAPMPSGKVTLERFENDNRKFVQQLGRFKVMEHERDLSVGYSDAIDEYFASKMNVRRRQVVIDLDESAPAILQAGAMQWMAGPIAMNTGVKGAGDFFGKMVSGAVTGESAIKPEFSGHGTIALEPTEKFIILQNVADWPGGLCIEDGMFLACDGTVQQSVVSRSSLSSAIAGGEGLFNLSLSGTGVAALESYVPMEELVAVTLENDTLKIDGNLAVMWSAGLEFTVERSSKSLIGSAASGEGLVNVYRGTGTVLMSPVAPSYDEYDGDDEDDDD